MARSSGGTYTLPDTPVVSGTTISTTVENAFRADVAAELTDSLSRSGKGPMTAPLALEDGSVALPAATFESDPDTGLYLVGANELGVAAGGVKVMGATATAVNFPKGVAASVSGSNVAVTGTSVSGTGSLGVSTDATGHYGQSTNGTGVWGETTNGDYAVRGEVIGADANTNDQFALEAKLGHFRANGGNPTKTTGFTNTVTPTNIIKAHGQITATTLGAQTVAGGFNVASAALVDDTEDHILVTFTTAMLDANYTVVVQSDSTSFRAIVFGRVAGSFKIALRQFVTPWAVQAHGQFSSTTFDFIVTGAQ